MSFCLTLPPSSPSKDEQALFASISQYRLPKVPEINAAGNILFKGTHNQMRLVRELTSHNLGCLKSMLYEEGKGDRFIAGRMQYLDAQSGMSESDI